LSGVVTAERVAGWGDESWEFFLGSSYWFSRSDVRWQAWKYLRGLMATIERRSGWSLAEHAGDATPDKMQGLLVSRCFDRDKLRDEVRSALVAAIGDEGDDRRLPPAAGACLTSATAGLSGVSWATGTPPGRPGAGPGTDSGGPLRPRRRDNRRPATGSGHRRTRNPERFTRRPQPRSLQLADTTAWINKPVPATDRPEAPTLAAA
jgi:hypothetical protein